MFAARANQENAVYEQQTAAVAKTQQGTKGLAPKTPAKTLFRSNQSNENAPTFTIGKTAAKGAKADPSAFVTPAGPRTRAPLGIKTTNAKALKTPALLEAEDKPLTVKPTSPRLRRPKIKVHEAVPTEAENVLESDEDDIEYMPPRGTPLPDYPDDIWPHDREYPQLRGENLTRGWFSEYCAEQDGDVDDDALSDLEEKFAKTEETQRKQGSKGYEAASKTTASIAAPGTLRSRDAARALAARPNKPSMSTASHNSRAVGSTMSAKPMSKKPQLSAGNARFSAAKAASKTTIGYSRGRAVSSMAHQPLARLHEQVLPQKPSPAASTTLDDLLRLSNMDLGHDANDDGTDFGSRNRRFGSALDLDDELEGFQLELPEDT